MMLSPQFSAIATIHVHVGNTDRSDRYVKLHTIVLTTSSEQISESISDIKIRIV